jgi:hypothetical protein
MRLNGKAAICPPTVWKLSFVLRSHVVAEFSCFGVFRGPAGTLAVLQHFLMIRAGRLAVMLRAVVLLRVVIACGGSLAVLRRVLMVEMAKWRGRKKKAEKKTRCDELVLCDNDEDDD